MSNTTGNKIVDEISALHINSIPETWYYTIKRNNQPHAMAILVLWDLVYWYKWTEVRDEASGLVIGYKKKFKADLLQRSYEAISNKFGISKRQATDVIVFLEKMGAVKRVFRNIRVANTTLSNVLFIELVPSVIKKLCDADLGEVSRNGVGGSHVDSGDGLSKLGETYTTTSTNNTTIISNSSTSLDNPPLLNTDNNKNSSEVDTSDFPEDPNEIKPKKTTRSKRYSKTELNEQFISSLSEEEFKLSERCADLMIEYLTPITTTYNPAIHKTSWQADFARRARDKKVSLNTVLMCVQYVHDDTTGFEQPINQSPEKIFRKLDYLFAKALTKKRGWQKSNYQQKRESDLERGNMNTGNRDYSL